jgi:ABC-2 type transport system permease protein
MFWKQVRHVFQKEFAQLRRNPDALRILFIAPLIQTLAFGYAATTDIRDIPFILVDQDRTPESRALIERFTGSSYFRLVGVETTPTKIDAWLVRGNADLALVIPSGYAKELLAGRRPQVQVLADGTDSNSSMRGLAYAGQIVAQESAVRFAQLVPKDAPRPGQLRVTPRVWYNPDLKSRWYMVPAVMAMVLMIVLITLGAMAVVRERETGTMEQLIVTPLDPRALMLGKLAPYAGVGLIEVLVTTAIAVGWFRVPLRGSFVELVAYAFLFVLVVLALGLLVSTMARTQQQAMMASMFFIMTPMIYLSGFLFPIENMPPAIQAVTYLLPLRYFAEIVRGVFLKGATIRTLWPNALALAVFAVGLTLLAARRFRKTLD